MLLVLCSKDQASNRKAAIKTLRSLLRGEQSEQESMIEIETGKKAAKLKRLSEENETLKGHLNNMSNSLKESYRLHEKLAALKENDANVLETLQAENEDLEAHTRAANKELKELRELVPDTVYAMNSETQTGPGELGIYFDTTPSGGGIYGDETDGPVPCCHQSSNTLCTSYRCATRGMCVNRTHSSRLPT